MKLYPDEAGQREASSTDSYKPAGARCIYESPGRAGSGRSVYCCINSVRASVIVSVVGSTAARRVAIFLYAT